MKNKTMHWLNACSCRVGSHLFLVTRYQVDQLIQGTNPTVHKRATHLKPGQSSVWIGPTQDLIAHGWELNQPPLVPTLGGWIGSHTWCFQRAGKERNGKKLNYVII